MSLPSTVAEEAVQTINTSGVKTVADIEGAEGANHCQLNRTL